MKIVKLSARNIQDQVKTEKCNHKKLAGKFWQKSEKSVYENGAKTERVDK